MRSANGGITLLFHSARHVAVVAELGSRSMQRLSTLVLLMVLCNVADAASQIGLHPVNYREKIKAFFNQAVPEPRTTSYDFDSPRVEKIWRGLIRAGYHDYWVVHFRMNTKKRDGTFTGPFPCAAVFDRKGEVSINLTEVPKPILQLHAKKP